MEKDRLLAFSDGVIAVIITIMVLELKAPRDASLEALKGSLPVFLSYVLSFIYVGIYWNNHHHFFSLVTDVKGSVLWANLHLLFWLSLIPFATSWLGEYQADPIPTAVYGVSLLMPALAWYVMQTVIVRHEGSASPLAAALSSDLKGKISAPLYLAGISASFIDVRIADALYVLVALLWLVPDRRIERRSAACKAGGELANASARHSTEGDGRPLLVRQTFCAERGGISQRKAAGHRLTVAAFGEV